MTIAAEGISEEEKAIVVASRCWRNEALVVDGQFRSWERCVYAGALVEWLSVVFGEAACCALKAVQDSVD